MYHKNSCFLIPFQSFVFWPWKSKYPSTTDSLHCYVSLQCGSILLSRLTFIHTNVSHCWHYLKFLYFPRWRTFEGIRLSRGPLPVSSPLHLYTWDYCFDLTVTVTIPACIWCVYVQSIKKYVEEVLNRLSTVYTVTSMCTDSFPAVEIAFTVSGQLHNRWEFSSRTKVLP